MDYVYLGCIKTNNVEYDKSEIESVSFMHPRDISINMKKFPWKYTPWFKALLLKKWDVLMDMNNDSEAMDNKINIEIEGHI